MAKIMSTEPRKCPYCNKPLTSHPYWKHIQEAHPAEYESDKNTWIQLFKDYTGMGMGKDITLNVISEIFNKPTDLIEAYLKLNKVI
jgi:hypothetical protein